MHICADQSAHLRGPTEPLARSYAARNLAVSLRHSWLLSSVKGALFSFVPFVMDPPSKNDSQQRELISVQQQAPARSLQGSPSHIIGALNYPRSADAQDGDSRPLSPSVIRFYDKDKPYYSFTNFSPDPVYLNQQRYPTNEHLFQALKVDTNVTLLKRARAYIIVLTSS